MIFLPAFWCKPEIKKWVFCSPFSCSKSGLWPFNVWFYNTLDRWDHQVYGIGSHFLWVADAHIEVHF